MLVGGAVRDLLLGGSPREYDVTVAADVPGFASGLVALLTQASPANAVEPHLTLHERFGTASIHWVYGRFDVVARRAESYPAPGALPVVRPGTIEEDLARRDFTVNAIALHLGGPQAEELVAVEHAFEDLAARCLRVMHEGSFIDDPTRALRLARYSARLGFQIEPHTRMLAQRALTGGALETVSGGRISSELAIAALNCETAAFVAFGEIGVLGALGLAPSFDMELAEAAKALAIGIPDCHCEDVLMAVAFHPRNDDGPSARQRAAALLDRLEHPAAGREQILASGFGVAEIAAQLRADAAPSRLRELLAHLRPDGVAVVGALAERATPGASAAAVRWLEELRNVRLQITGDDLIGAGIPAGPDIGRRLDAALRKRLDGEITNGRDAELQAALEA